MYKKMNILDQTRKHGIFLNFNTMSQKLKILWILENISFEFLSSKIIC